MFFTVAKCGTMFLSIVFCPGEKIFEVGSCFVGEGFLAPTFAVFVKEIFCFNVILAPAHELEVIGDLVALSC